MTTPAGEVADRLSIAYFVSPSVHFAGIERVTHEIASGLADAHPLLLDVHVIYSSEYDEPSLASTPYTKHVLGVDRLRNLAAALRRVVEEHEFDVLVVPQIEASVIAWAATRRTGLGMLVPHLHGNPRLEFEDGTRRTRAAFRVFRTVVARQVPVVLAVSPSLRDYAARSVAKHAKVVFAKNPVRQLTPVERVETDDGRFRFVCVARLSVQKGQDVLLRAVALARPELPPFVVTLVGQGDQEGTLRALAHDLGLDDVVVFAGYAAEPAHQLAKADCFVLASRWEGFGVALVEALQAGLPVVATSCEFGPADIVTDPVLGELATSEDPTSLAAALVRTARRPWDPSEADARRQAAAEYAPAEAVATHFSILQSLRR